MCPHGAAACAVVLPDFAVRFFSFLPPLDPFFFARVTLIGCGVPGRGSSASKSYGVNRDGGGVATPGVPETPTVVVAAPLPLPSKEGERVPDPERGGGGCDTAPSGISPVLSMTKVCAGGAGELRRLGRRGVGATAARARA